MRIVVLSSDPFVANGVAGQLRADACSQGLDCSVSPMVMEPVRPQSLWPTYMTTRGDAPMVAIKDMAFPVVESVSKVHDRGLAHHRFDASADMVESLLAHADLLYLEATASDASVMKASIVAANIREFNPYIDVMTIGYRGYDFKASLSEATSVDWLGGPGQPLIVDDYFLLKFAPIMMPVVGRFLDCRLPDSFEDGSPFFSEDIERMFFLHDGSVFPLFGIQVMAALARGVTDVATLLLQWIRAGHSIFAEGYRPNVGNVLSILRFRSLVYLADARPSLTEKGRRFNDALPRPLRDDSLHIKLCRWRQMELKAAVSAIDKYVDQVQADLLGCHTIECGQASGNGGMDA
jgi:hypothetical protein